MLFHGRAFLSQREPPKSSSMGMMATAYDAAMEDQGVRFDAHQAALLAVFDELGEALCGAQRKRFRFQNWRAPAPKGIYLSGSVGRGKSMLMDIFFETLPIANKKRVHFHAFMQDVHCRIHKARQSGISDVLAPVIEALAKNTALLCLDEMQINDIADAMIISRLFQRLLKNRVVIVTTSNHPPSGLYKAGLNRDLFLPFIDILHTRFDVLALKGSADYRQEKLSDTERYLCPLNAETEARMGEIWDDLSLSAVAEIPLTLALRGRKLTLRRFRNGAARAPFESLCAQPLGAEDYLALCANLRVLMIEKIPRMGRQNANEARRFITLIDAAYEARLIVVFSAAAPPEELYLVGDGAFDFKRTASRLYEMRANDWGA